MLLSAWEGDGKCHIIHAMAIRIEWNVYKTFWLIIITVRERGREVHTHVCDFMLYFGMGTHHIIAAEAERKQHTKLHSYKRGQVKATTAITTTTWQQKRQRTGNEKARRTTTTTRKSYDSGSFFQHCSLARSDVSADVGSDVATLTAASQKL